jgi:hypothetical protein
MIVLKRERCRADAVMHITGRDIEEAEVAFSWDAEGTCWMMIGDAATVRMSKEETAILAAVERRAPEAALKDLYSDLPGIKQVTLRSRLARMVDDGKLSSPSRGIYSTPCNNCNNNNDTTSSTRRVC